MEEESLIDERITRLKKKKERLQTQKALLLYKEAQNILGDKFSYELVLSVLENSWNPSSDKQKEEWIKSSHKFRGIPRKTKRISSPQSEEHQNKISKDDVSRSAFSRESDSQTTTENS